eukprot:3288371-Heterocapsa_arctica.AAC.1
MGGGNTRGLPAPTHGSLQELVNTLAGACSLLAGRWFATRGMTYFFCPVPGWYEAEGNKVP